MGKLYRAMERYTKLAAGDDEDYQDTLTAITPANNTETKVKAVLEILYDNVVEEEEELSAGQIEDLIDIAELCPYDYGFGVYMARSLLMEIDPSIRYYNACESVPESSEKWDGQNNENSPTSSGSDNELFKLYPNPANNIIVLDYVLPDNQEINAIFELRDLTGRIIMNVQLNKNRTFINMDNLNAGVYSYSLLESGQIKYAGSGSGKWDGEPSGNQTQTIENQVELFRVYPNPARNSITIEYILSENQLPNAVFEIYDVSGRNVNTSKITSNRTVINTDKLNSGMYYYSLKEYDELKYSGKQIIIK